MENRMNEWIWFLFAFPYVCNTIEIFQLTIPLKSSNLNLK